MASIREQILDAVVAALSAGSPPATVERSRSADLGPADLPSIIVYPIRDQPGDNSSATRPAVLSRLTFVVECRAAASASVRADEAVDPLYVWVVQKLGQQRLADGAGGWLNHDMVEGETAFAYDRGEAPYCLASIEFDATYQHLRRDPELRA